MQKDKHVRKILIATLILLSSGQLSATPNLSVIVVAALDPESLQTEVIDLYREIEHEATREGAWIVVPFESVRSEPNPVTDRRLASLGSIASIERRYLTSDVFTIDPLQRLLDSNALDGALVVDCEKGAHHAPSDYLSACNLAFYDRIQAKIKARSRKIFKVGVADAKRWAPQLVKNLAEGMRQVRLERDRESLEGILNKDKNPIDTPTAFPMVMELDLNGHSIRGGQTHLSTLPELSLGLGVQSETYTSMVSVNIIETTMKYTTTMQTSILTFTEQTIGLMVGARTKVLDSMSWDLSLFCAAGTRRVKLLSGTDMGEQEDLMSRIGIMPGLLWNVSSHLAFGTGVSYTIQMPLKRRSTGLLSQEPLALSNISLGLRIRTIF